MRGLRKNAPEGRLLSPALTGIREGVASQSTAFENHTALLTESAELLQCLVRECVKSTQEKEAQSEHGKKQVYGGG